MGRLERELGALNPQGVEDARGRLSRRLRLKLQAAMGEEIAGEDLAFIEGYDAHDTDLATLRKRDATRQVTNSEIRERARAALDEIAARRRARGA